MSGTKGWGDVVGNITNPDIFLEWINENVVQNRVRKQAYAGFTSAGGRAVYVGIDGRIYPFDINDPTHYDQYVGVTQTECVLGRVATYVVSGVCIVVGSRWQAGVPYYISSNGFLTDAAPVSGLVKLVGVGIDPDRILVISTGSGSSTPSGDENIDGGFANSVYLTPQLIDGGGA